MRRGLRWASGCASPVISRKTRKERVMSTATIGYYAPALDYQADHERAGEVEKARRSRRSSTSRKVARPAGFNGIHRRRKKRWTW